MALVVLAWELGGGLGHLAQMLPLAEGMVRAGIRVVAVVRELAASARLFHDARIELLQAPVKIAPRIYFPEAIGFAHLLGNACFWDEHEVIGFVSAWRNLFRLLKPDLVVFDHSPTALAAARGMDIRRALIGSGFCCPPPMFFRCR